MSLATVFPQAADIPAEFAHKGEITQREYLLNGELVQWQGELSPVVSPIYIRNSDSLQQVVLGHTPLLDGETALKALDSAVKAYDLGRGAWPTMAVLERIQHVETFLGLMQQQRDDDTTRRRRHDATTRPPEFKRWGIAPGGLRIFPPPPQAFERQGTVWGLQRIVPFPSRTLK